MLTSALFIINHLDLLPFLLKHYLNNSHKRLSLTSLWSDTATFFSIENANKIINSSHF